MRGLLFLLALLSFAACAQNARPTTEDPVANKRAVQLAEELRCLVCQNQSIAESNAELAVDLWRQIREQIAQNRSDSEIMSYMVERYGDFVLYRPPVKTMTLLLWFGPLALLLGGLFVLFTYLRHRGKNIDERPLTDDERHQADALLGPRGDGKT